MGREREFNCIRDGRMFIKFIENMLRRICSSIKNLKKREFVWGGKCNVKSDKKWEWNF